MNPSRSASAPAAASLRCFVALQPDEGARDRLDRLARAQQARFPAARRMRRENLHLTLAFIGAVEATLAREVASRLAGERFEPFAWSLDTVGAFGGARVLWAGGSDARLDALVAGSRRLLDDLRVRFDRKPFVAHVTLLRKLPREAAREAPAPIDPPILWKGAAPVLLQSRTDAGGTHYTPVTVPGGNG